jgi:hypothetical protein
MLMVMLQVESGHFRFLVFRILKLTALAIARETPPLIPVLKCPVIKLRITPM